MNEDICNLTMDNKDGDLSHREVILLIAPPAVDSEMTDPVSLTPSKTTAPELSQDVLMSALTQRRFCRFCAVLCSSVEALAYHIFDAHLLTLKTCSLCLQTFNSEVALSRHVKLHKVNVLKMHTCSKCKMYFRDERLEEHEFSHHEDDADGMFLNRCFPHLAAFINMSPRKFIKKILAKDSRFPCSVCKYVAASPKQYIKHLKRNKCNRDKFVCDNCCKPYSFRHGLFNHVKRMDCALIESAGTSRQSRAVVCRSCNRSFGRVYYYRKHRKECMQDRVRCLPCDKRFDSLQDLNEHLTKCHQQSIEPIVCTYCSREFAYQEDLDKHFRSLHEHRVHLYRYKCVRCDKIYKHPKDLFSHYYGRHRDLKPFTCEICNLSFSMRRKFTLHIKLIHKGVGFVEFDENFYVHFTDKKSDKQTNDEHSCPAGENTPNEMSTPTQEPADLEPGANEACQSEETMYENEEFLEDVGSAVASKSPTIKREDKEILADAFVATNNSSSPMEQNQNDSQVGQDPLQKSCKKDITKHTDSRNKDCTFDESTEEARSTAGPSKKLPKRIRRLPKALSDCTIDIPKSLTDPSNSAALDDQTECGSESSGGTDEDTPLISLSTKPKFRLKKISHLKKRGPHNKLGAFASKSYRNTFRRELPVQKKLFCSMCSQYCFTLQNYNRHMSGHFHREPNQCLKCARLFRTKELLQEHTARDHQRGRLSEKLQKLISKFKTKAPIMPLSKAERFSATIEKVKWDSSKTPPATVKRIDIPSRQSNTIKEDDLSVQKFLENFSPEGVHMKKDLNIAESFHCKFIDPLTTTKKNTIRLQTYKEEPLRQEYTALRYPVKYKDDRYTRFQAALKVVDYNTTHEAKLNFGEPIVTYEEESYDYQSTHIENRDHCYYNEEHIPTVPGAQEEKVLTVSIPEAGEEVMLDVRDLNSPLHDRTRSVIISTKMRDELNGVQVAHMIAEQPYYKIVGVQKLIKQELAAREEAETVVCQGLKLVTVNPLAHLLGNKKPSEILQPKYYKNKPWNFPSTIAQALEKLETQPKKE